MRTEGQNGRNDQTTRTTSLFINRNSFTRAWLLAVAVALLGMGNPAQADLLSQIPSLNSVCGSDIQGQDYKGCTAGEISISEVVNVIYDGSPTQCVLGDGLTILSAQVNYSINTQERNDLVMWIGDQQGTDPRLPMGPGATCSAYSLPAPFNPTPDNTNPFGDVDGDECGDLGFSVSQASRIFTDVATTCQDNDHDGKTDLQVLLTWSQNAGQACGTDTNAGQSFPTVGAVSKCDFSIINTGIDVVYPPILTLVKTVTNNSGGLALPTAWTLTATGPDVVSGLTGTPDVTSVVVSAGDYALTESGPAGYSGTWTCTGGSGVQNGDTITLSNFVGTDPGEVARTTTCTLANDDIPAMLTLVKNVVNDNGGTGVPSDWTLSATGPTVLTGAGGAGPSPVNAGVYTLTETSVPGYQASAWGCTGGGSLSGNQLTLALGEDVTCTITNDDVAASLTLTKTVTNNNGGTAVPTDWTLNWGAVNFTSGQTQSVNAGTATLGESGPGGYTPGSWQCTGGSLTGDSLTIGLGESVSCSINNDDQAASLTLTKTVTNNNGGTAQPTDWTLNWGAVNFTSGQTQSVDAGTATLGESGPGGYTPGSWQCTGGSLTGDSLMIGLGETVSCTIDNDDIAPTLTLVKVVDGGGPAVATDWTLAASGPTPISGAGGASSAVDAGDYTLSETGNPPTTDNYTPSAWSCVGGDQSGSTITLAPGQSATCTITNTYVAPGSITLTKSVVNDNGGTAVANDFDLFLVAVAGDTCNQPPGSVKSGYVLTPPTDGCTYSAGESLFQGYTQTSVQCTESGGATETSPGLFTFATGQTWSCVITNDDDAPSLTLDKVVVNDSGGTQAESAWTISATGPTSISGPGAAGSADVVSGPSFDQGTYTLGETGPGGYSASAWVCTGGGSQNGNQITLGLGESATCQITNDDIPARLTLTKIVVNDNGGSAVASDWTLSYGATNFTSGQTIDVNAGTASLSESGPAGYQAGAWQCTGGTLDVASLTVALDEDVSCTITNNDIAPTLTLVKDVTNDDGGQAQPEGFVLTLQGADGVHDTAQTYSTGATPAVKAGVVYTVDEQPLAGYQLTQIVCLDGETPVLHPLTLALGQNVTCTVYNDDQPATLTLHKVVTNDDGGTLSASDFTLNLTGADGTHDAGGDYADGDTPTIVADVEYTVSEDTVPENYEETGIVCQDVTDAQNPVEIVNPFTTVLGHAYDCVVNNDDLPPTLTLVKVVINDDGGSSAAGDFDLTLTGADGTHDAGVNYADGDTPDIRGTIAYTVSETPPDNYELIGIQCLDAEQNDVGTTFTAVSGDDITCTVTNDDILQNAYFTVRKDFSDDNPAEVDVQLTCNTGLPLQQTLTISEGHPVKFVVHSFEPGSMDCHVEETSGGNTGYTTTYDAETVDGVAGDIRDEDIGCYYDAVERGEFTCDLTNTLDPVTFTVNKQWLDVAEDIDIDLTAGADYTCFYVRTAPDGGLQQISGNMDFTGLEDSSVVSDIYPDFGGNSYCVATESGLDSTVEGDDSDCSNVAVTVGQDASCTIYNTVFFEGIPTLSQWGLAILAVLTLGIGLVGFRRFV